MNLQATTRQEATEQLKAANLSLSKLQEMTRKMGYRSVPKTKAQAIKMIADRVTAATIAGERAKI